MLGGLTLMTSEMRCPKCDNAMEKGYIYPQGFISWSNNNYKNQHPDDEKIVKIKMSLNLNKKEALRCKDCKIVTFQYD
jgi:hypothetical protein